MAFIFLFLSKHVNESTYMCGQCGFQFGNCFDIRNLFLFAFLHNDEEVRFKKFLVSYWAILRKSNEESTGNARNLRDNSSICYLEF